MTFASASLFHVYFWLYLDVAPLLQSVAVATVPYDHFPGIKSLQNVFGFLRRHFANSWCQVDNEKLQVTLTSSSAAEQFDNDWNILGCTFNKYFIDMLNCANAPASMGKSYKRWTNRFSAALYSWQLSAARTHDAPDSGHTPAQFSANGHTWNISPMCPRPQGAW